VPGYQSTPIPPCFFADDPDPACQSGQGHDGSGTSGGVPTTGTTFPGDGASTEGAEGQSTGDGTDTSELDADAATSGSGSESTGVVPEPEIVDLDLDPDAPKSAGPVTVTVQAANAVEVWMTVDNDGEVALEPVGDEGSEFVGEIAVIGESWNGDHIVSAVARAGELESPPWEAMFTVTAPAAGTEAWKTLNSITPSIGNAVAVDAQGDVYELFTEVANLDTQCYVQRRDAQGDPVWPQKTVQLAAGVRCVGEEIEVAPDGHVWVLVNTVVDDFDRWQLFYMDPDGTLLDEPQVGGFEEFGRGLDVNEEGDVLLCGTGPGVELPDAWVKLSPTAGVGWTVPWVHEFGNVKFDERARGCTFVEDRVVVVGEAFGKHEQNNPALLSRGFVVEFGINGVKLAQDVTTDVPALQSGHEAVAPDGDGGYVAVGYTCDAEEVPCNPKKGVVRWFSFDALLAEAQPNVEAMTVWDVATSLTGGVVVAAQAHNKPTGFLVQAWTSGAEDPFWEYQGALSSVQVATGIAVGSYGPIWAGGYYLDGNTLAAGVVRLHPY
jgi:hypothetical protein